MDDVGEDRVAAGYDVVYEAIPASPTFARIWRQHALGADYPVGFEHISFLTLSEMTAMASALHVQAGSVLVDLACGMGGPGLWIAREAKAQLVGIDISAAALAGARSRAEALGLANIARFDVGSFAETALDAASADGAMSCDALQYAPDKQAALLEIARVLRPGASLAFVCFEFEPERVAGLPIFGTDPVDDYRLLLERAGFDVVAYDETPGWRERVNTTYQACIDARPALTIEMGEAACTALLGEMSLTLQLQPYRRRVFVSARRR
jgi:SAM-dependent methyltransferase